MNDQDHLKLVEGYIRCYNCFDIEGMLAYLSENVIFENESAGEVNARANGKGEFKKLAEQSVTLFSARNQEITGMEENGDSLTAYISYSGVLAVDLPNGLKSGQAIELVGRSEFRFEHGKISHIKDIS